MKRADQAEARTCTECVLCMTTCGLVLEPTAGIWKSSWSTVTAALCGHTHSFTHTEDICITVETAPPESTSQFLSNVGMALFVDDIIVVSRSAL